MNATPVAAPVGRFAMYKKQEPAAREAKVTTVETIRKKISQGLIVPAQVEQKALVGQAISEHRKQLAEKKRAQLRAERKRKAKKRRK